MNTSARGHVLCCLAAWRGRGPSPSESEDIAGPNSSQTTLGGLAGNGELAGYGGLAGIGGGLTGQR